MEGEGRGGKMGDGRRERAREKGVKQWTPQDNS
jgi:hypothetical protein